MIEAAPPKVVAELLSALGSRRDSTDVLSMIKVPTLVICGAEDAITPAAEAREWSAKIAGAKYVEIPGAGHLANRLLALPPPTYRIEGRARNGLVDLPASMFLLPYHGVRRFVPAWSRFRQAESGIRTAARQGEIFHLSFHPFNLPTSEKLFFILERIFGLVAELRGQGKIEPRTMTAMARLVLACGGFAETGGARK